MLTSFYLCWHVYFYVCSHWKALKKWERLEFYFLKFVILSVLHYYKLMVSMSSQNSQVYTGKNQGLREKNISYNNYDKVYFLACFFFLTLLTSSTQRFIWTTEGLVSWVTMFWKKKPTWLISELQKHKDECWNRQIKKWGKFSFSERFLYVWS